MTGFFPDPKLTIVDYPECHHGYFSRGELSNPDVVECVERAYNDLLEFFGGCLPVANEQGKNV